MSENVRIPAEADPETPPVRISRFQLAVAAVMVVAGAIAYPSLPARIPQHWNAAGQIDAWANKSLLSVFYPVLFVLGLIVLAWLLPRIDPLKRSYARFTHTYYLVMDIVVGFMAFLFAITLYAAFQPKLAIGVLIPVAVGLLLAVLGNQFGKVKRNFFMGIRTPWTLASERVWTETHRFGGRVFVGCGLVMALAAFLPAPYNALGFMLATLVAVAGTVGASYVIYRRLEREGRLDNDLQPPRPA